MDNGLRLGDVDQYPTIDVTIDGADEYVDIFHAHGDLSSELREG